MLRIGVDAGGSGTRVRVVRDGETVGEATGPSGAVRPGQALATGLAIAETVRRALVQARLVTARVETLVVGAAGAGREPERQALAQALRGERLAEQIVVTTDIAIAFADAFGDGPGLLLAAGTGSVAMARDAAGAWHRAGGWGWQVGDEGSGAWLGREAVRLVLRMRDGRADATPLAAAVREAARMPDDDGLVRWGNAASAGELASLAPVVLRHAADGDPAAARLRAEAASALAELVGTTAAKVPVGTVAWVGGLLRDGGLRDALADRLAPQSLAVAPADPLAGALRLAGR